MLLNLTSFALRSSDRDGSSDENQANTIRAISAGVQTATDLFDTLTETLKKDDPNRPEPCGRGNLRASGREQLPIALDLSGADKVMHRNL